MHGQVYLQAACVLRLLAASLLLGTLLPAAVIYFAERAARRRWLRRERRPLAESAVPLASLNPLPVAQ